MLNTLKASQDIHCAVNLVDILGQLHNAARDSASSAEVVDLPGWSRA